MPTKHLIKPNEVADFAHYREAMPTLRWYDCRYNRREFMEKLALDELHNRFDKGYVILKAEDGSI